jgi:hypothetical protein
MWYYIFFLIDVVDLCDMVVASVLKQYDDTYPETVSGDASTPRQMPDPICLAISHSQN